MIRWGTTPLQESIVGTLADIAEKVRENQFKPPAIIVVGRVCSVREDINWFERQPLLGKKVLVTRTRQQASTLVRLLERKGAGCIECPTIEVRMVRDTSVFDNAVNNMEDYDWIIFSSTNAVKFFFARIDQMGKDIRVLGRTRIAAVGSSTADAICALHLNVDALPDDFRAEGLLKFFRGRDMKGKRVLIPRAVVARKILPRGLRETGASVTVAPIYETIPPEIAPQTLELLEEEAIDVVTFTSSSTVKNLFKTVPEQVIKRIMEKAKVSCIGPVTARTARNMGLKVEIIPDESTVHALVNAIEQSFLAE